MSGTYFNGTYTSVVTLSTSHVNETLGPRGVVNAYGLAGTYTVNTGGGVHAQAFNAAMFGPAAAHFTITNKGLIESHGTGTPNFADAGIILGVGGTVLNAGTIAGGSGIGILGTGASYVENSKLIEGSAGVGIVMFDGSGTVVNTGTIGGASFGAVALFAGGLISNASGGVLSSGLAPGAQYAISTQGAPATVQNAGTITGYSGGINLQNGGFVTNSGFIHAVGLGAGMGNFYGGVEAQGGVVLNSGTIAGQNGIEFGYYNKTTGSNIPTASVSGYVHNTGLIEATTTHGLFVTVTGNSSMNSYGPFGTGIFMQIAGTVVNGGSITASNAGIFTQNSYNGSRPSYVQNTGSGRISGGTFGAYLENNGSLNNAGAITGGKDGVFVRYGAPDIVNAGSINGVSGAGVDFYNSGTLTNTGTITGAHHGIVTGGSNSAAPGTITNAGLIESSTNTFSNSSGTHTGGGIALLGGGFISNQSTGIILGANGIYATASAGGITIENAGSITGTYKTGIVLATSGYISNSGSIGGVKDGIDLKAGGTVVDRGTISGGANAIYFGPSNSRLVVESGARIIGSVTAAYSDLSTSFLELGSAGSGASFDLGGTVNGFNDIAFDSGQDWTLEGNISELGNGTVGIYGFTIGDTLILTGFTASSETFNTGLSVLSLSNATSVDQLTFFDTYNNNEFKVTDVAAGTELTLQELCYLRGTRILTPQGERLVEDLRPGDAVITRNGGAAPLKWIGVQRYAGRFLARDPQRLPVRIRRGALGATPLRDLVVSPGHALLLGDVLVLAKDLVNGITIMQESAPELVEYYALELEAHDCVLAEGALAESFADGPGLRRQFHNAADFYARFPDYVAPDGFALCAPRPEAGPQLEAALRPVVARAAMQVKPGAVRGHVDILAENGQVEGWAQDLAHPDLPVLLEIRADGVAVGTALAHGFRADLLAAGIGKGRAMFSFAGPPGASLTVHGPDGTKLPLSHECHMRLAG